MTTTSDSCLITSNDQVPMAQIEKMFRDMDITHSGEVDYTEFIAAANATTGAIEKPSN